MDIVNNNLISSIKDGAEKLRHAGFTQDEFLYNTIAHLREQDEYTNKVVKQAQVELASIKYILSVFGDETLVEFEKMMKSLRVVESVFSRQELLWAIRHDMRKWKEFTEAWPEYHQYLIWKGQKDKMIESANEDLNGKKANPTSRD